MVYPEESFKSEQGDGMTRKQLFSVLNSGQVAAVSLQDWQTIGRGFDERESYFTGIAGTLRLGSLGEHLVVVEEADANLLAVRPLGSPEAASSFVQHRLAAYDRLWDG